MSWLYGKCHELFAAYPLAVQPVNRSGTMRSMILMLQEGAYQGYLVLTHDFSQPGSVFWIWSWPAGAVVDIDAEGTAAIPDRAGNAVTAGVPIPRDGSLFGWSSRGIITALVVIHTKYTPETPVPSWSVMPLAGLPEAQWPPFTADPVLGHWTWEGGPSGGIVSIDELIATRPDTVFWVDTKAVLGSDCCAVARDLTTPEGHVLRRGRYAHHQALQASKPVPSLHALLADPGRIDLAPRLERSALAMLTFGLRG